MEMTRRLDSWDGPGRDYCSRKGAEELAARLDAYWHERGFPQVQHWVERTLSLRGTPTQTWAVRSNLICGRPPPPDPDVGLVLPADAEIGCDVR